MRKLIFFLFLTLLTLAFLIIKFGKAPGFKLPPVSTTISPTQSPQTATTSPAGNRIVWLELLNKEKLFLYSNLDKDLSAKDFATKNSCLHIISGGFYSQEGGHIGLLISEGNEVSPSQNNNLFNGYFSLSEDGLASITTYPTFSPRISLQSGPILLNNGKKATLSLQNDENARRVAVGISKDDTIYFMVVYNASNPLLGPTLEELPDILQNFSDDKKLSLTYILNLDGGAHSTFITDFVSLTEVSPVGSFFCIKP